MLVRQNFEGSNTLVGEEGLYGEGSFPNDYTIIETLPPTLAWETLLAQAKAWKWSLGSLKDASGKWTILHLYKEVLYNVDGRSYVVDSKNFSYGESIEVTDLDAGINIGCSVPLE